jgi:NADH:ubiquinone oxidoreductase subunit F (NADH-binding)
VNFTPKTNFPVLTKRIPTFPWGDPKDRHIVSYEEYVNTGGYVGLRKALTMAPDAVTEEVKKSQLRGRGGAGFPCGLKWTFLPKVAPGEDPGQRYLAVNADESEPGTFKDRMLMDFDPHLMLEGIAIACYACRIKTAFVFIRGEYHHQARVVENAIREAYANGIFGGQGLLNGERTAADGPWKVECYLHRGAGAYICGEETALLEAIEGRRGMPRLKPPYPTESGLWGKPTLMNNVETLACVPAILLRGGEWFRKLGRTEPGSKLYCISGHVQRPGVYELPLGVTLDELVEAAGGYLGTPKAFSPGGASSGFLPMSERNTALDFGGLAKLGSMLGSAGVVVLDDTVDMAEASRWQQIFFEDESCGQCAPCRIGCRVQRHAVEGWINDKSRVGLAHVEEVAWEMNEGSICGLGMVASLPLQSAMKYFPEDFS